MRRISLGCGDFMKDAELWGLDWLIVFTLMAIACGFRGFLGWFMFWAVSLW